MWPKFSIRRSTSELNLAKSESSSHNKKFEHLRENGRRSSTLPFVTTMQENTTTLLKLAKTEQQLHESHEKQKILQQRLQEKEHFLHIVRTDLEKTKAELEVSNSLLEKEITLSKELKGKLQSLETVVMPSPVDQNKNSLKIEIFDDPSDEINEQLNKSITPIADLMLSCTLCQRKIKVEDMETHSETCSVGGNRTKKSEEPITPRLPDMLVATVTTGSMRQNELLYKVISKTTLPKYKSSICIVERTKEEFIWFRRALEELHPARIIPPIKFTEDLTENLREIQRFLSRLCAHSLLKADTLVRKFLSAPNKELEKTKKSYKKQVYAALKPHKPIIEVVDKEGLLNRTQTYVNSLIESIDAMVNFFKTNNSNNAADGLSKCFVTMSNAEDNETYFKVMTRNLSGIIGELENKSNLIYDESNLAEDLDSILEFVKSADELLMRVEQSVNTFLYWEEEMRVFEEMKQEGASSSSKEKDITQFWAEASSNCHTAKEELERMCRNLSAELAEFDLRKEQELKQTLLEYTQSRLDVFEKLQSKWFGAKLMLEVDIVPELRAIDFNTA